MREAKRSSSWRIRDVLVALRVLVWIVLVQLATDTAATAATASAAAVQPDTAQRVHELQSGTPQRHYESSQCVAPPNVPGGLRNDIGEAHEDLLTWATKQREFQSTARHPSADDRPTLSLHPPTHTQLLIGVKSAVISGFSSRQLLRQTWADPARLPDGVFVVFLGCKPAASLSDTTAREELVQLEALRLEKATYRDLLTNELQCHDSYFSLVDKVKGFFRWTAATTVASLPQLAFVMLVDDDVFVHVNRLLESLLPLMDPASKSNRFYAGEVVATQFRSDLGVDRDPTDKNAVPYAQYTMSHKPPFATGAHYVLSSDLVQFLARNDKFLKGVGTLEDVSVAYWLQALMQVQPRHIPEFDNVRYTWCFNSLIAYGDLSQLAIREMDANLRANRSLCHGFSFTRWDKRVFQPLFPHTTSNDPLRVHQLHFDWDPQFNVSARTLQIATKTITANNESASLLYSPTKVGYAHFCEHLFLTIDREMPTTAISATFCNDHRERMVAFLSEIVRKAPATAHLFALPLSNLHHGLNSALILVRLTQHVVQWRLLVECLLAAAFPDALVTVRDEADYAIWLGDYPSDIVFVTTEDLYDGLASPADSTSQHALGEVDPRQTSRLPPLARLVLVSSEAAVTHTPLSTSTHYDRAILISSISNELFHPRERHLFLPAASKSFANRMRDSPRALLEPVSRAEGGDATVGCCACKTASETATSESRRSFIAILNALGISSDSRCYDARQGPLPAFHHDADVERCRQFKFAVAFEANPDTPGSIGHEIVSAFLAGSIPIYYGHSATASWLFNAKAFIDCRSLESLEACAAKVAHVHASADLYEVMRREPPVVNLTAFMEVFSWHPDVVAQDNAASHLTGVSQRFRDILLDT